MNALPKRGLFVCTLLLATLTGCSSPANREAMTTGQLPISQKHEVSVSVKTSGGADTGAMDSSNISDADLKAAIEDSIAQNAVFKRIVQGRGGDYELTVSVASLDKPIFGASFTVNFEAGWTLTRLADRSIVYRKAIKSSHTATMGDAFVAVTRLRLAVEGAVKNNIAQGLKDISNLKL